MKLSIAKTVVNLLVLCAVAVFALPAHTYAATMPPEVLKAIEANYPDGLPRYLTPEEKQWLQEHPEIEALEAPAVGPLAAPPAGTIHAPAEYEPLQGVLVAWEGYTPLLTSFVVEVSQSDTNAKAYVVVDTTSERTTVTSTLTSAGANMSNVEFIVCTTDTVWIRDYGPRYILGDNAPAIIDHKYNRTRVYDDAFPTACQTSTVPFPQVEPLYHLGGNTDANSLIHGGGNFHCFSNGDGFSSTLVVEENPTRTQAQIIQLFHDYFNVNLTIYTRLPSTIDATGHIDMWFMPLSDNKVLISQFASGTGKTITDAAAADMAARGYTVYRTPAWNSGSTHYTYTNAAIVNNKVFIPWYNSATNDAAALATFQAAMPGYEIIQIDCVAIIPAAGAIHCVMKHVYTPSGVEPPGLATIPSPANTATNISLTADLGWTAGSGATSHIVYFGTSSPGTLRGEQAGTTYDTGTMSANTTYYWRIDEKNAAGTTTGDVWSFTTVPPPPAQAGSPSPADLAINVGVTTDLGWTAGSGATSHIVYFGTSSPGTLRGEQAGTTYDTGTMSANTTYYWRIDEKNAGGTTTGTVWSFTTQTAPPALPWSDGFESGDLTTGGWTPAGTASVTTAAAYTGTYGAYIPGGGSSSITKSLSTVGFNTIHVLYDRRLTHNGATLVVDWSTDGSTWYVLETLTGSTAWASPNLLCTSGADNNAGFRVRFRVTSTNGGRHAYIDNVQVTGTAIPATTTVPNVVGQTQAAAATAITGAGLIVGTVTNAYSDTVAAGLVISQAPASGTVVYVGSAVNLVISLGKPTVPNVVGSTQAAATAAITAVDNLTVGTVTQTYNNTVAAGLVISQNPVGGTQVNIGSSVNLVISLGKPTVPNVVGMTQAAATAAITAVDNLTVGTVTQAYSNTVAAGLVISQNPVGGTQVNIGSAVDLVISLGKPTVPNIVGSTQTAATAAITAVDNLTVGTVTQAYSDTVAAGLVISQTPAGGTQVNIGSSVDMVISLGFAPRIISGYITEPDAVEGVVVNANNGGGSDTTDVNGFYELQVSYGWSGAVDVNKTGYTFEPNGIDYNNVTTDQTNQNYTATLLAYVISGYVLDSNDSSPIDGVLMSGLPGDPCTNGSGYYSAVVDYGWSGTVTPTKYAYAFEPNSIEYANVTADQTGQDYAGTLLTYSISGCILDLNDVPIDGVLVSADNGGGLDTTDPNGYYEVWVSYNWSGAVTPTDGEYTFAPANRPYSNVLADQANQDYVGTSIYDLYPDGIIDWLDLDVLCENWLTAGPGDFDNDGNVDLTDYAKFANVW